MRPQCYAALHPRPMSTVHKVVCNRPIAAEQLDSMVHSYLNWTAREFGAHLVHRPHAIGGDVR